MRGNQQTTVSESKPLDIFDKCTKPSDIGKMPFEQFEPFDRRGEGESSKQDKSKLWQTKISFLL